MPPLVGVQVAAPNLLKGSLIFNSKSKKYLQKLNSTNHTYLLVGVQVPVPDLLKGRLVHQCHQHHRKVVQGQPPEKPAGARGGQARDSSRQKAIMQKRRPPEQPARNRCQAMCNRAASGRPIWQAWCAACCANSNQFQIAGSSTPSPGPCFSSHTHEAAARRQHAAPVALCPQVDARAEEEQRAGQVSGVDDVVLQRAQRHHSDQHQVQVVPVGRRNCWGSTGKHLHAISCLPTSVRQGASQRAT